MATGGENREGESEATDYLIIGGGLAGATAAMTLRKHDPQGRICIISQEANFPYNRPPLSKEFLRGETDFDATLVLPGSDYESEKWLIELRRGKTATAVDTAAKTVSLDEGATITYKKLLIATGASAAKLDPKETPNADAPNIYYLRTIDEAKKLKSVLTEGKHIAVLGAGYIGMEVAADAAMKGLHVTVIDTAKQPWSKNTSPEFGAFLRAYYEAKGVEFLLDDGIAEFTPGADDKIVSVRTKSGATVACDFVVAGVGAKLNLDVAKIAGLELDPKEGVTADEFLRTSAGDVYVAGDIARFHDPVLGKDWHIEHWQNAQWQGEIAGANMAGVPTPYDHIPYFFSDEFDLHMTLRGDPQAGKSRFAIGNMEPDTDRFLELYLREDGTLAMGLLISKSDDETATSDLLEKLIRARAVVGPHQAGLVAGTITLESLL